jgi:hypothetical protein
MATVRPELDELDRCLSEALRLAQNFAERMRLTRMQILVTALRDGPTAGA